MDAISSLVKHRAPNDDDFRYLSTQNVVFGGTASTPAALTAWGRNENGESEPPIGETFVAISSGSGHTCALREDGTHGSVWQHGRPGHAA